MITYEELTASISSALYDGIHFGDLDRGAVERVTEIAVSEVLSRAHTVESVPWEDRYSIEITKPKLPPPTYRVGMDLTKATDEQLQEEIGKRYAKRVQK